MSILIMRNDVLADESFKLALTMVELYKRLSSEKREYVISKQLLRSGTSIGANICEAKLSMSKNEFIMKLNISLKETGESLYWVKLLQKSKYLDEKEAFAVSDNIEKIKAMLIKSIKTTKSTL